MNIVLHANEHRRSAAPAPELDEDLDDVTALIGRICAILAEAGSFEFHVSGFGDERWPVDIRTDLAVFLEQVPEAIHALDRGDDEFTIDFYEQGIERSLRFMRRGDAVSVHCESMTNWAPDASEEIVSIDALRAMLTAVAAKFVHLAREVAPALGDHPWLRDWEAAIGQRR